MNTKHEAPSRGGVLLALSTLVNVIILEKGITVSERWYFLLLITVPLYIIAAVDLHRKTSVSRHRWKDTEEPRARAGK